MDFVLDNKLLWFMNSIILKKLKNLREPETTRHYDKTASGDALYFHVICKKGENYAMRLTHESTLKEIYFISAVQLASKN